MPVEKEVALPGGERLTLVLIPPGEFVIGASEMERTRFLEFAKEAMHTWAVERIPGEGPPHRVRITRPFYLGKYETSQAQWFCVDGDNPSRLRDDPERPVDSVTWDEVAAFLERLNAKLAASGMRLALPTEAQWEYACRAGTTSFWNFGDDTGEMRGHGWFRDDSGGRPQPVDRLSPNAFGLHDLHGNVWKWCADRYAADYYERSPVDHPPGSATGDSRVFRGGVHNGHSAYGRSAYRTDGPTNERVTDLGFRVAMTIELENVTTESSTPASDR